MANFPDEVWDGLTPTHPEKDTYKWGTHEDFVIIRDEIQAIQHYLLGDQTTTPGTDPEAKPLNDTSTIVTKDIIVPIGGSAVASVDVGYDIPAGSVVVGAAMNIESTVTLATATKIGLGVAGSLAKYGSITGGTKNNKSTVAVTPTAIAANEDLKLYATDNSSAAAGTMQNGSIRIRLTIISQTALADAA